MQKQRRSAQSKRDRERQRCQHQRRDAAQLLFDRATTGHMLGDISVSTLIRLEEAEKLVPIKPSGRANGKTFYAADNVRRLAGIKKV